MARQPADVAGPEPAPEVSTHQQDNRASVVSQARDLADRAVALAELVETDMFNATGVAERLAVEFDTLADACELYA